MRWSLLFLTRKSYHHYLWLDKKIAVTQLRQGCLHFAYVSSQPILSNRGKADDYAEMKEYEFKRTTKRGGTKEE